MSGAALLACISQFHAGGFLPFLSLSDVSDRFKRMYDGE